MVCWILLLALLEHESGISLYLVTRDLPDCHNLSKVIESHSVMVADSSLSILGWILCRLVDLCFVQFA